MRHLATDRRTTVISALTAVLLAAPSLAAAQTAAPATMRRPVEAIDAADLRRSVGVLAHDSMRGRDTPSPELEATARWVADRFREIGLRPGLGDDGYLQRYPLTVVDPGRAGRQRAELEGPDGTVRLRPGRDFVAAPTGRDASARGALVTSRRSGAAAAGDSAGGILILPATRDELGESLGRMRDALRSDRAAGGIIAVDAPGAYFERLKSYFDSEQISLGEPDALSKPVILVRRSSLPGALTGALEAGGSLPEGWTADLGTAASVQGARAMNTIGWVQGSDPELRNEYVIFTAHMDHVGVGRPVDGDSIYNGADDDASGTAAIVELAEAFAAAEPAPRRSVVFMTVSGEEKGLLGSEWYAEHPVFPLDRTVAAVNMDMIGRNWDDTVAAVGKKHSTLGETVDRVAEENPELGLTVVEDPWPEQRFFYRSDHYNFARRGVPALFFFSGVHEDYHRPSDEPGKIDYEKTARVVRLLYLFGHRVADADERPRWDPGAREKVVGDRESR